MSEPTGPNGQRPELRAIQVVPREVADEIIAEALETIRALEAELEEVERGTADRERLEAEADFLIEQAHALVADAHEHRARVMAAARAEAAAIIDAAPSSNGHR